jgi:hypothetical protein
MNAITLLLMAQSISQGTADAADSANQAYVQCLFATSRAASAARLSVDVFENKLASSCAAEENDAVRALTAALRQRGESNAASTARQAVSDARRSVVETYRRATELQLY